MKVVFDLDQTLVDNRLHIVAAHIVGVEPKSPTRYDLADIDERVAEECYKLFNTPAYMCSLPALPGVRNFINIASQHHELSILTARPKNLIRGTEFMVQAIFGDSFKEILFTDKAENKADILKNMNVDLYVDDYSKTIMQCHTAGIGCVLIHNENTTYNPQEEVDTSPRVIKSIIELQELVGPVIR